MTHIGGRNSVTDQGDHSRHLKDSAVAAIWARLNNDLLINYVIKWFIIVTDYEIACLYLSNSD